MSKIPTFKSLADAVQASFPRESCRVVSMKEHGDTGYALFDTRPSDAPYLYEVYYDRREGSWSEGSSGNGPSWHRLDDATELGVLTEWGEAPRGSDSVRIQFRGEVFEEAVSKGAYLFMWWDVPRPKEHPQLIAFRVNGEWRREPQ